jgi:hypothetical protein
MQRQDISNFRQLIGDHDVGLYETYQQIKIDDSAQPLTVDISSQRATGIDPGRLHLTVSSGLPINDSPIMSRVMTCLQYWTPSILSIQREHPGPFSLRLACSDEGDASALSMDWESTESLIPDIFSTAYAAEHKNGDVSSYGHFQKCFFRKQRIVFWRGSTTGRFNQSSEADLLQNPRVAACLKFRNNRHIDFKIARLVQVDPLFQQQASQLLADLGIIDPWVDESMFGKNRFYIDLPGNASSWGTFKKYLMGCLVLRPLSTKKLLYHAYLRPFVHYVPLEPDLADMEEKLAWLINNPEKSSKIAYNGNVIVRQYVAMIPRLLRRKMMDWIDIKPFAL